MRHGRNLLRRERPQSNGTEKSSLDSTIARHVDGLLSQTGGTAESYNNIVGIVTLPRIVAHFRLAYLPVLLLQMQIVHLHHLGLQLKRSHYVGTSVLGTPHRGPRTLTTNLFLGTARTVWRQYHTLHHLSDNTVAEYHDGVTVLESQIE